MTKRKRRNHSASFKAKVAVAAVRGDPTHCTETEPADGEPEVLRVEAEPSHCATFPTFPTTTRQPQSQGSPS